MIPVRQNGFILAAALLQHHGRRQARRKRCQGWRAPSSIRREGAPRLALIGRFGGSHPAHYLDIRRHEDRRAEALRNAMLLQVQPR
jgi:hypothetical protein